ncbi:MAG: 50S ribosomal protein L9 [Holosporales bacterium]|jgi:large subunit ribosomal protein L9|nr:50S ribosomal protein L9 [Holosporales bacterium]
MRVILLGKVGNLGNLGNVVNVKDGYARNFLLPRKKALRASKENLANFEKQKAVLETENLNRKSEAEQIASKMDGLGVNIIRQAGESGHLFGSVRAIDVSNAINVAGYDVKKSQICINNPIKTLGIHILNVMLHPEVSVCVKINVAQSIEEAEVQISAATGTQLEEVDTEN